MTTMKTIMKTRTYSELCRYSSFEDRFEYLKLGGSVGRPTFGFDRHINQDFYTSTEWRGVRRFVIIRDYGRDLGVEGHEADAVLVHHMNPMTPNDVIHHEEWILDPEFLITCTPNTHNAIHYGDASHIPKPYVERRPGDTRLWGHVRS